MAPDSTPTRTRAEKWAPTLYFVVGQIGWFGCVLSAARGAAWMGVTLACVLILLHLWRVRRPGEELKLIVSVMLIGAVWETVVVSAGLLAYPTSTLIHGLPPLWLPAEWAMFAAQFNTTYQWLKSRVALAAVFGAIAGPVSFHAGAALGALQFVKPWPAAAALAVGWAGLLPLVTVMSRRWDGVRRLP